MILTVDECFITIGAHPRQVSPDLSASRKLSRSCVVMLVLMLGRLWGLISSARIWNNRNPRGWRSPRAGLTAAMRPRTWMSISFGGAGQSGRR